MFKTDRESERLISDAIEITDFGILEKYGFG